MSFQPKRGHSRHTCTRINLIMTVTCKCDECHSAKNSKRRVANSTWQGASGPTTSTHNASLLGLYTISYVTICRIHTDSHWLDNIYYPHFLQYLSNRLQYAVNNCTPLFLNNHLDSFRNYLFQNFFATRRVYAPTPCPPCRRSDSNLWVVRTSWTKPDRKLISCDLATVPSGVDAKHR